MPTAPEKARAVNVTVKLEHSERQRLKSLAAAKQRTPHFLMKEAIQRYIEDEEAEHAAIQAAAASGGGVVRYLGNGRPDLRAPA